MLLKHVAFTCFSLFALSACGQAEPGNSGVTSPTYDRMLKAVYRNTVPTIKPVELVLEMSKPSSPQLLDARSPAEFKVSHLRGARFVNYDSLAAEKFVGLDRSQPVVVYCSVGYRSERLGERLYTLGFKNVRNLYGGLFEWVNQNYPVYNAQGRTHNVHPYSALWSPWLKNGQKVYE
ncbi:rhodanese-like domain-containing protein [Hymenobacter sp. B1770]|uniref:rhodanese-like domain-containing protein n=1 Tax=Hymenobacter sp. B1770 TaxID=1718788 RepID=UPI003CF8C40E